MADSNPLMFLTSSGLVFGLGFILLTGLSIWLFLQARDLATAGLGAMETALAAQTGDRMACWLRLSTLRAELSTAVSRAQITTASISTLALLGTCLGFFFAIARAAEMDPSTADPIALLDAMMKGGIDTALATTVLGQGLYLLLSQAWSWAVARPVESAFSRLDEGMAILRARLTETEQQEIRETAA